MRGSVIVCFVAAGLILQACGVPDPDVCNTPPTIMASAQAQQPEKLNGCIHRWAYRLARSNASAKDVAEATVAACDDAVLMAAAQFHVDPAAITLNQQRFALFRVIQARAGHCRAD